MMCAVDRGWKSSGSLMRGEDSSVTLPLARMLRVHMGCLVICATMYMLLFPTYNRLRIEPIILH